MAIAGDHIVVKMDDSAGTLRTFAAGDINSVELGWSLPHYMPSLKRCNRFWGPTIAIS
jgi:hypothetical protein